MLAVSLKIVFVFYIKILVVPYWSTFLAILCKISIIYPCLSGITDAWAVHVWCFKTSVDKIVWRQNNRHGPVSLYFSVSVRIRTNINAHHKSIPCRFLWVLSAESMPRNDGETVPFRKNPPGKKREMVYTVHNSRREIRGTINCTSVGSSNDLHFYTNVCCVAPSPCRPNLSYVAPAIEVVSPQHRNCIAPSKKSNSNCVLWSLLICHGSISFNDRSNTNNSSYFGIFCNSWNKACYKRWSLITFNKPLSQKNLPDLCSCWSSVKGIAGNGENLYKFQVLTSQATCFSKARCTSSTS